MVFVGLIVGVTVGVDDWVGVGVGLAHKSFSTIRLPSSSVI